MAKYYPKCECCGKSFCVQLYGPTRDREYKLENWTWVCDDCRKQQREEAAKKAAEEAKAEGLPALSGTDKQIVWAEQIRAKHITSDDWKYVLVGRNGFLKSYISSLPADPSQPEGLEQLFEECWGEILNTTSASWWIDHRDLHDMQLTFKKAVESKLSAESDTTQAAEEAKAEAMLVPADGHNIDAIAEISVSGEKTVAISLPEKHEPFRLMVKAAGYGWNNRKWMREASLPIESAIYVGTKALALGIRVICINEEIRKGIESGAARACWITSNDTHAFLRWWSGDWFQACKKLPSSKWDRPFIRVPIKYAEELIDFANTHNWGISGPTRERLDAVIAAQKPVVVDFDESGPSDRPKLEADDFDVNPNLKD